MLAERVCNTTCTELPPHQHKRTIRILGIDPGSRVTGFGVIDVYGQQYQYVASGCIKTEAKFSLPERIGVIVRHLDEVVETYQPTQAAVEQVFVNVNPASTLILGQARGAAIAALVMRQLPVYEYTALQVKQAVVGQGKAAKEQVQHMVVRMLNLSGTPQADAADALAVALTHALRNHSLAAQIQQGLSLKAGRFH
ncbi:crossover junction endodeoxyribonuclease RuvC [Stenoxybacter acetivorans]|uniref:crossover junction endodeoxyribonuclease RuvC n=1 Tax=Stenoxybacter acetivorans TaxID=422441 RepID=UPI0009FD6496|nr:crossover junction endodeoxyribonuclease RuvC [Stenoxybacter acetivorans]